MARRGFREDAIYFDQSGPAQGLPETIYAGQFDDPETLAGFIGAMRWGAVTVTRRRSGWA